MSVGTAKKPRDIMPRETLAFNWPTQVTRVTLAWYPVYGNFLCCDCARSTVREIQLNSDARDHGDKPL